MGLYLPILVYFNFEKKRENYHFSFGFVLIATDKAGKLLIDFFSWICNFSLLELEGWLWAMLEKFLSWLTFWSFFWVAFWLWEFSLCLIVCVRMRIFDSILRTLFFRSKSKYSNIFMLANVERALSIYSQKFSFSHIHSNKERILEPPLILYY